MTIEHEIIIGRSGTGMSLSTLLEQLKGASVYIVNHGESADRIFRETQENQEESQEEGVVVNKQQATDEV